jgi:hypothetical protein
LPSPDLEISFDQDPEITTIRRRIFLDPHAAYPHDKAAFSEDVQLTTQELEQSRTQEWTYYKSWQYSEEKLKGVEPKDVDVFLVHGKRLPPLFTHGAKYLSWIGYREYTSVPPLCSPLVL